MAVDNKNSLSFPRNFPEDLRTMTEEQSEQWIYHFANTYPVEGSRKTRSLRWRQELLESQIGLAYQQLMKTKDPVVKEQLERGLYNLRITHDICSAAIDLKEFSDED